MKKQYLFATILFLLTIVYDLQAQISIVLEGVEQPTSVLLDGNDLYYGEFQGGFYKYDITTSAVPIVIFSTNGIYRTVKAGNFIYISESFAGRISKIDITEPIPQPVVVIENLDFPAGLAIKDNFLYFAENVFDNSDTGFISKIDLNESSPVKTIVSSETSDPNGIGIIGNDLYFSEWASGNIFKIDLTNSSAPPVVVVSGLSNPTEIIVSGNNLLVSEFSNNKVLNVDVSSSPAIVTDIVTDIISPTGLFLSGEDLYISEFGANQIVKFGSPVFGVLDNQIANSKLVLSPNPSTDFVQVSGLTDTSKYTIYNNIGTEVNFGTIADNQKLNVMNLETGVYFIRFENGNALKFIKK